MIQSGAFAVVVTLFITRSRLLTSFPDIDAQMVALDVQKVCLLAQVADTLLARSGQINSTLATNFTAATNSTQPVCPTIPPESPHTQKSIEIVMILWFLSLIIAIFSSFMALIIQEWTLKYFWALHHRTPEMTIQTYALNDMKVRLNAERWGLHKLPHINAALLNLAVLLFVVGLAVYVSPILPTTKILASIGAGVVTLLWALRYIPRCIVPWRLLRWLSTRKERRAATLEEIRARGQGQVRDDSGGDRARARGGGEGARNEDEGEAARDEDGGFWLTDEEEEDIQEVPREEDVAEAGQIMMRRIRLSASQIV